VLVAAQGAEALETCKAVPAGGGVADVFLPTCWLDRAEPSSSTIPSPGIPVQINPRSMKTASTALARARSPLSTADQTKAFAPPCRRSKEYARPAQAPPHCRDNASGTVRHQELLRLRRYFEIVTTDNDGERWPLSTLARQFLRRVRARIWVARHEGFWEVLDQIRHERSLSRRPVGWVFTRAGNSRAERRRGPTPWPEASW